MLLNQTGIEYKKLNRIYAVTQRIVAENRGAINDHLAELAAQIPETEIIGPPFAVFQFVTSITGGSDVEIGYPVKRTFESKALTTRFLPAAEVLTYTHIGPKEALGASYQTLFGFASQQGLMSDEFAREVYHQQDDQIEIQFIMHNWNSLFTNNLERVLGKEISDKIQENHKPIHIQSSPEERFEWAKNILGFLDQNVSETQKADIVSSCAHVFPKNQTEKLRSVFFEKRQASKDPLDAVDAVIAFMDADPGWGEGAKREGYTVFSAKNPRDPKAYAEAKTDAERKAAYCFCPTIRNRMDQGMPTSFCYCGGGWFRQQWEEATGKPVRIEVLKSILKGDDECKFAIHLSEAI
jgi:effector-binding domain-containing protein